MIAAIELYDDPINPHGWALAPVLRRLRVAFPDADWRVRPIVLVDSWADYDGPEIDGGRQGMAAVCAQLSERSGMPIDEYLWFESPPSSSTDACRAVAAASPSTAAATMRTLREAIYARRTDISDPATLRDVLATVPGLDAAEVADALQDGSADDALARHREAAPLDLDGVTAVGDRPELPTLVASGTGGTAGISGRRRYDEYRDVVADATGLDPRSDVPDLVDIVERFSPEGWVATAELAAVMDEPVQTVRERAADLADAGELRRREFAAEPFWRVPELDE